MYNVQFVAIVNGENNLLKIMASFVFGEALFVVHDIFIHIPTIAQFLNKVQFGLRIDDFVQSDHIWMLDEFHASNLLDEMCSRDLIEFCFIDHFHSNSFSRKNVSRNFDNSKVTAS